ncbi:MAG: hypothetical protein K2Q06_09540, partial [Parvularculaceae bacterium]|nr:hypothetical protein [Parvularculaceae bacterium]
RDHARIVGEQLTGRDRIDDALKLRTVTLPKGVPARYVADDVFDFPVGTIVTKTFYYETGADGAVKADGRAAAKDGVLPLAGLRLLETRVLVRRAEGWTAFPYVWNAEQTDAVLKRTGDLIPLTLARADGRREAFGYFVPNVNQCASCHATDSTLHAIQPIGLKARHLNKASTFHPGFNQLDDWRASGLLEASEEDARAAPKNADWSDASAPLDARARAYLDANCSHCHSAKGAADTSGLDLRPSTPMGPAFGWCKSPIAAGGGSGGRPFDIVPGAPDQSIFVYRLQTNDPARMMPELGRAVSHEEGVALIAQWIAAMEGSCG